MVDISQFPASGASRTLRRLIQDMVYNTPNGGSPESDTKLTELVVEARVHCLTHLGMKVWGDQGCHVLVHPAHWPCLSLPPRPHLISTCTQAGSLTLSLSYVRHTFTSTPLPISRSHPHRLARFISKASLSVVLRFLSLFFVLSSTFSNLFSSPPFSPHIYLSLLIPTSRLQTSLPLILMSLLPRFQLLVQACPA